MMTPTSSENLDLEWDQNQSSSLDETEYFSNADSDDDDFDSYDNVSDYHDSDSDSDNDDVLEIPNQMQSQTENQNQNQSLQCRSQKYKVTQMLMSLTLCNHLPPKYCSFADFEQNVHQCLDKLIHLSKETASLSEPEPKPTASTSASTSINSSLSTTSICISSGSPVYDINLVQDCLLSCIQWRSLFNSTEANNITLLENNSISNGSSSSALDVMLQAIIELGKKHLSLSETIIRVIFQISCLRHEGNNGDKQTLANTNTNKKTKILNQALFNLASSPSYQSILPEAVCSFILQDSSYTNQHQLVLIQNASWLARQCLQQSESYLLSGNKNNSYCSGNGSKHIIPSRKLSMKQIGSTFANKIIHTLAITLAKSNTNSNSNNNVNDFEVLKHMMELLQNLTMRCARESKLARAFQCILQISRQNPNCVCLRIAAIIACLQIRGYHLQMKCNTIHIFLRQLWQEEYQGFYHAFGMEHRRIDILRMYVEIVVECPIFDNVKDCWMAVTPLLEHLKQNGRKDEIALRGLGCILIHRGESVLSLCSEKYQQMVKYLNKHYGAVATENATMWGYQKHIKGTKSLGKALSKMGILHNNDAPLHNRYTSTSTMTQIQLVDADEGDMWPFSLPLSIRMLCIKNKWMKSPLIEGILCHRDLQQSEQTFLIPPPTISQEEVLQKQLQKSEDRKLRRLLLPRHVYKFRRMEKIKNKLNATKRLLSSPMCKEISAKHICPQQMIFVGHIFSFLNYKRLSRAMQICTLWNAVGKQRQDLWKGLYMRRWPNAKFPKHMTDAETVLMNKKWDLWFKQKFIAERKNRENVIRIGVKDTWLVKVCSYVGCTKVLFCAQAAHNHEVHHERKYFKNRLKIKNAPETNKLSALWLEGHNARNVPKRTHAHDNLIERNHRSKIKRISHDQVLVNKISYDATDNENKNCCTITHFQAPPSEDRTSTSTQNKHIHTGDENEKTCSTTNEILTPSSPIASITKIRQEKASTIATQVTPTAAARKRKRITRSMAPKSKPKPVSILNVSRRVSKSVSFDLNLAYINWNSSHHSPSTSLSSCLSHGYIPNFDLSKRVEDVSDAESDDSDWIP